MRLLSTFSALILAALMGTSAQAEESADETPAAPKYRTVPDYPASCTGASDEPLKKQQVIVVFDVNSNGATENVRVRESTNPCFDDTAVAAARGWTYEPRRVNGSAEAQEDLEVTLTFVMASETDLQDFDARPLVRVPPRYPSHCMRRAKKSESITVEFDVTVEGTTENIEIIDSTNSCLEPAVKKSVEKWQYRLVDGKPEVRRGVQTVVTLKLASRFDRASDTTMRRTVYFAITGVRKYLDEDNPQPEKALAELAEIEQKYGKTFSRAELSAFHQMRGAARLQAGDYAGALDDFRIVQRLGMAGEASEAIGNTIVQLEAVLAAQQASDAAGTGKSAASASDENESDAPK